MDKTPFEIERDSRFWMIKQKDKSSFKKWLSDPGMTYGDYLDQNKPERYPEPEDNGKQAFDTAPDRWADSMADMEYTTR